MAYAYRLRQGPKTLVRICFNDLPVVRQPSRGSKDDLRPADHLLVPGKNTMRLEIWDGPPSPDSPGIRGIVELTLHEIESERMLGQIFWPHVAVELGLPEDKHLPFRHEIELDIPETHPPPVYAGSPREEIPPTGTPAQREAVARLHDALVRQDARAFVDQNALKLAENKRFFGATASNDEAAIRSAYEARFAKKLVVAPLDEGLLRFEPRSEGRVCYVTRTDGLPVLRAEVAGEPGQFFAADPVFVRDRGDWTLLL
jgi:hypothetical protein